MTKNISTINKIYWTVIVRSSQISDGRFVSVIFFLVFGVVLY